MKLFEVLTKPIPTISRSKKDLDANHKSPKNHKYLGDGSQTLSASLHIPSNVVVKTITINGQHDPVYQYIRACINSKNPYLPKIYKVKQYKNNILIVTMEHLIPIRSADIAHIYMLFGYKIPTNWDNTVDSIEDELSDLFSDLNDRDNLLNVMNRATDPNLKKALRLLCVLLKHYDGDFSLDNIMIRPNTNQVVFLDPIYIQDIYDDDEWSDRSKWDAYRKHNENNQQ